MANFRVLCNYQEGTLDKPKIKALEKAVKGVFAKHLPDHTYSVVWSEVPKGQGYTDNQLSDTSWIVAAGPDGMAQELRETILQDISDAWAPIAGIDPYNLMISLFDASDLAAYQGLMMGRLEPEAAKRFTRNNALGALWSKLTRGYMRISVNYK